MTGENANRRPDELVWARRVGDSRIHAFLRHGRHGPFLVFKFDRVFASGRTHAFAPRDLECLRPLLTHALRFARNWRPDAEARP